MLIQNDISDDFIDELLARADLDGIKKISVGALISKEFKLLFLKRIENDFLGGFLDLPGGGVNKEEKIINALIREVKEETSLDVLSIKEYLGSFDYVCDVGIKTRQFTFSILVMDGNIQCNPAEHTDFLWLSLKELKNFNITDNTKKLAISFYHTFE